MKTTVEIGQIWLHVASRMLVLVLEEPALDFKGWHRCVVLDDPMLGIALDGEPAGRVGRWQIDRVFWRPALP